MMYCSVVESLKTCQDIKQGVFMFLSSFSPLLTPSILSIHVMLCSLFILCKPVANSHCT